VTASRCVTDAYRSVARQGCDTSACLWAYARAVINIVGFRARRCDVDSLFGASVRSRLTNRHDQDCAEVRAVKTSA